MSRVSEMDKDSEDLKEFVEEEKLEEKPCFFCSETVNEGAFWHIQESIFICWECISNGKLGLFIGDAWADASEGDGPHENLEKLERVLKETERQALRTYLAGTEEDE